MWCEFSKRPRIHTFAPGAVLSLCFLNNKILFWIPDFPKSSFILPLETAREEKLNKGRYSLDRVFFWLRSLSCMYITIEHRCKKTSEYLMWLQHEFMQATIPKLKFKHFNSIDSNCWQTFLKEIITVKYSRHLKIKYI